MDPRVQKLAEIVVRYCIAVRKDDWVVIMGPDLAIPLANACVSEVLKVGGHPSAHIVSHEIEETILREAGDEQLSYVDPTVRMAFETADVFIAFLAPGNTRALSDIDPARSALRSKARESVMETYMKRSAEGDLRWAVTAFPTQGAAQDAGMSLRLYEDFVYGACLLGEPDPVAAWRALGERQQRIADWLADKQTVHIKGSGIDLTVGIGSRTWINDNGHENFPGGEVFTGPVEDQTQGVVEFNLPGFYEGQEVSGVRLVFRNGAVVDAGATTNEPFLLEMLDADPGARRLGEFAFGLNPGIQRFSKSTLFDEKIGGTLHMALGRAYPETGGKNESAIHWDMVYDLRRGAEVTVDGQTFSRNGEILI